MSFIRQIVENGASGEMWCLFSPLTYLSVRQFDLLELIVQSVPLARVLGQYGVGLGKDMVAEEVIHVHHLVITEKYVRYLNLNCYDRCLIRY